MNGIKPALAVSRNEAVLPIRDGNLSGGGKSWSNTLLQNYFHAHLFVYVEHLQKAQGTESSDCPRGAEWVLGRGGRRLFALGLTLPFEFHAISLVPWSIKGNSERALQGQGRIGKEV